MFREEIGDGVFTTSSFGLHSPRKAILKLMSNTNLSSAERAVVRELLRTHGVLEQARISTLAGRDELVIVLPSSTAAFREEQAITQELQDRLHRKVWLAPDEPIWEGQTEEL